MAMRTAPPAIKIVPIIIQAENTSPSRKRAKKAFHNKDTAPKGARMTTGSDAIWNNEPSTLEDMKIAAKIDQLGSPVQNEEGDAPNPNSHNLMAKFYQQCKQEQ